MMFLGLFVIVIFVSIMALFVFAFTQIAKKAGYHPALGLLAVIPYVNIIFILIFAFSRWPIHECLDKDKQASLQKPLSPILFVLMIVAGSFPFLALLAAIAIPNFLRAKVSANDALAKSTVRVLSTASESYASDHEGEYPAKASDLLTGNSSYIETNYCNGDEMSGFTYQCENSPNGYVYVATPVEKGISGTKRIRMVTGGVLSEMEVREESERK